jgi:O-antigen/teichoic acid export membrane protein
MFPNTLIGPMYGRLLSGAGIFMIALFFFIKEYGIKFHKKHFLEIWRFCYPMFLYFMIAWVLSSIYPYILLYYTDSIRVGIFSFALQCILLLDFFQNGLASAIMPKIFNIWRDNKVTENTPEVNRYYNGFTLANLIVLPLFLLLIPYVVMLFVHKESYYDSFIFLPILTIGFVARTLLAMFSSPALFFKKTKVFPKVYGLTAIFQIVIGLIMIKYFGLMGAAITVCIVKILQVLFFYLESRKIYTFKFSMIKQIWLPLFYIVIVLASLPFMNDQNRPWLFAIQLILIGVASFFAFKKDILFTLEKKKNVLWKPWKLFGS